MFKTKFTFLLILFSIALQSQTTIGLIAHYDFDNQTCKAIDRTGNNANLGFHTDENTLCACGVDDKSLIFDGNDDTVLLAGSSIFALLSDRDFTISFYMRPNPDVTFSNYTIMSKRNDNCVDDRAFEIVYSPSGRFINVLLQENSEIFGSLSGQVDNNDCWFWIVITREGPKTNLLVNGKLIDEQISSQIVNLSNDTPLSLGKVGCDVFSQNYAGLLDEVRFYKRALNSLEIQELNLFPDRIANDSYSNDTLIFKGNIVPIYLTTPNCHQSYQWSPTNGICPNCVTQGPIDIEPEFSTTYTLSMTDSLECTAKDTINITVIDPDLLDCDTAFLPEAFTPNDDKKNDTFGVDNPLVIDNLNFLEIFDKTGQRVFATSDSVERWDGNFNGTPMNAGIFIYKISYQCNNKNIERTQTFTMIR